MSYHIPERKVEQGFKAYFGAITGLNVRTRFSGIVKELPNLEIVCDTCDPAIRGEDNSVAEWACNLRFTINTRYIKQDAAEGEAHDVLVGAVSDMIADQTLIAGMNAFSTLFDYTAILWKPGRRTNRIEDKDYVTELTGILWMVPSAT